MARVSAASVGSTACVSTSQKRKTRIPVATAASIERTFSGTFRRRAIGRPMKIVIPAIAPRRRVWPVLIAL